MRHLLRFFFTGLSAATIASTVFALTLNLPVTQDYVRAHPNEFEVKVTKAKSGRIDFKVTAVVAEPKYLVAHLSVHHQGRVIAESHSPSFSKNRENTFYFSLLPEDVAESTFELGESSFTESGGEAIPVVGSMNYQFQLKDFVPEALLPQAAQRERSRKGLRFPSLHVR